MVCNVLLSHRNLCFLAILCFGKFDTITGLYEDCNHLVELNKGEKIYINSPYFPNDYPIGTSCRYTVKAPLDHQINFKCTVTLNLVSTAPRCQSEIFTFNGEGSDVLTESDFYCSTENFERKSFLNRATISYLSQPGLKKNILQNTETQRFKDEVDENIDGATEEEYDEKFQHEESITTPTTAFNLSQTSSTNAFTYFIEMFADSFTKTNQETSTTTVLPSRSTTVEDQIPINFWRKSRLRRSEMVKPKLERTKRIVSNNSNVNNEQIYGYTENRGGGRFSCLVEVIETPCDCGWSLSLKIVGATGVAGINEFPSMAGVKSERFNQIFCGAAIIHHRYLISAAHCFVNEDTNRADLISVVVGENDFSTVLESLFTRTYEVEAIIPHELFQSSAKSQRNDIALLRTRLPIDWNRNVGPACLPFVAYNTPGSNVRRKLPLPGQRVETAGWGTTSFGGAQSTQLLKTTLDIFPMTKCRKVLFSVPSGTFCTFTPGRDTCQYDSGGALYFRSHRLFAVGIVSYGFACAAQQPTVNTRIASFTTWIRTKTPDASYCIK